MLADRLVPMNRCSCRLIAGCLLLFIVEGCQQRPTTVSGTITLDGRPLVVGSDTRGTVVFNPNGGRGTVATGLLDASGHFNLATGSSNEVAPGTYYVTVSVAQLLPKSDQGEQGSQLITPAKYASARESGLEATVQPGENKLGFDLHSGEDNGNSKPPESPADKPPNDGASPAKDSTEKTDR